MVQLCFTARGLGEGTRQPQASGRGAPKAQPKMKPLIRGFYANSIVLPVCADVIDWYKSV